MTKEQEALVKRLKIVHLGRSFSKPTDWLISRPHALTT